MLVLALLTFLTIAFWFLRSKYLSSPLGDYFPESQREHIQQAAEVLQKKGFRIVDERIAHEIASFYGSRQFITYIVVDFLVEKDGQQHPVKVRSPRDPERINGVWLRRYLLPLYLIYEVPVAYVFPEIGAIEMVDFAIDYPGRYFRKRWRGRLLWLTIGVLVGWLLSVAH